MASSDVYLDSLGAGTNDVYLFGEGSHNTTGPRFEFVSGVIGSRSQIVSGTEESPVHATFRTGSSAASEGNEASGDGHAVYALHVDGVVIEGGALSGDFTTSVRVSEDRPDDAQVERTLFFGRRPRAVFSARPGVSTLQLSSTGRSAIAPAVVVSTFTLDSQGRSAFRR